MEQLKQQILKAIDSGSYTLNAIKKAGDIPVFRDISDSLEELIQEKVIRRSSNGTITMYCRYEMVPKKFWLSGTGNGLEVEWDTSPLPAVTAAAATAPANFNAPFSPKAANGPKQNGAGRPSKIKTEIDPETLERLAREGMTRKEAAAYLGMSLHNFNDRIRHKDSKKAVLCEAWTRGQEQAGKKPNKRGPYQTIAKKHKALGIETELEEVVDAIPVPEETAKPASWSISSMTINSVHAKYVTLSKGGQIIVGFEGSVFDLKPREVELITDLSDRLYKFEQEGPAQ